MADEVPGVPRWLKLSAIAVLVALVAAVVASNLLGIQHGPSLH